MLSAVLTRLAISCAIILAAGLSLLEGRTWDEMPAIPAELLAPKPSAEGVQLRSGTAPRASA